MELLVKKFSERKMGDMSRICAGRFDRSILTKLSSLKTAGE